MPKMRRVVIITSTQLFFIEKAGFPGALYSVNKHVYTKTHIYANIVE